MGRGIALQLCTPLLGMRLAAIANRHVDGAARAWADAGHSDAVVANDQKLFDQAVARGRPVATSDPALLCHCENIDAIIEVTGHVESSAATVLEAIAGRKHIVLMNAELDATLGPILNARAEEAGVIYSNADGDEPGLLLNLIRHVRTIGYQPVMAGNLKGLLDRYRTAETQRGFAERHRPERRHVCRLCRRYEIEFRGLRGRQCHRHGRRATGHVRAEMRSRERCRQANRATLIARSVTPTADHRLRPGRRSRIRRVCGRLQRRAGQAALHELPENGRWSAVRLLPPACFAAPGSAAHRRSGRAIWRCRRRAPGRPVCEVIAVAKRDLPAGSTLDGMGGYDSYGLIENAATAHAERLLPMGLSVGYRLLHAIAKDEPISYHHVELPNDRLCDQLRGEQERHFSVSRNCNPLPEFTNIGSR